MQPSRAILLLVAFGLFGCDRLTGADQQKILDAEAIGYACRVSLKTPEDCMKENETMSPTSILTGWKSADKDIDRELIDPSMGKNKQMEMPPTALPQAASAVAGSETKETGKSNEKQQASAKPAEPPPQTPKPAR